MSEVPDYLRSFSKRRQPKRNADWFTLSFIGGFVLIVIGGLVFAVLKIAGGQSGTSVGDRVAAVTGSGVPSVLECSFRYGVSFKEAYDYKFTAKVRNDSRKAVDSLIFYVRSKQTGRTVPTGECLEQIKIPGGIEPGETRIVVFSASLRDFGKGDYPEPPDHPFEVAVVDNYPDGKPYEQFKNIRMINVTGDYRPVAQD